jgi:magnesium transporter
VVQHIVPGAGKAATLFRDVQENAESYHFYADELLDDANTLLNVQLALASHRTGEVMRVLTVFSVFFLPLTFIVGVYGMNFRFMPELNSPWGYPAVLGAMLLVTLLIYRWFRSRGWLRE